MMWFAFVFAQAMPTTCPQNRRRVEDVTPCV